MKYYRKKNSLYILHSCHLQVEIGKLNILISDLLNRPNPSKLFLIQNEINKLVDFMEKLTTYSGDERKTKFSISIQDKNYIISEMKNIDKNLLTALSGSQKILNGCNTLKQIFELRAYLYKKAVYQYWTDEEVASEYFKYYKELTTKRLKKLLE